MSCSHSNSNIFTDVCLSTWGSFYDVTSCLAVCSHVPSVGWGLCQEGLCLGGLCPGGSVGRPPHESEIGRHASYWNAFLFLLNEITNHCTYSSRCRAITLQKHLALRQNQCFSTWSWYIKDDINPVISVTWSGLQRKVHCFPWMNLVPDSTKR